jgi:gamma-tubulin complex component 3
LISLIHGFSSSHGDPLVGAFAERLLTPVTRPFYDMLRHWIYDGELSDPYHEFFVSAQDANAVKEGDDARNRTSASSVWEDKYDLNTNMIPSIVTEDFAQKVFLIGKSLNFIRYSCGDSSWVEQYSKAASKELQYGDTATLESWIDEAYKTTMARLMHLMTDKFHLYEHLKALKDYIFLGQGDFIALLMESLSTNLDRPAGAQYRHTLTAQLEHAIRGSNAQYDSPEVLRRLDARMLHLSHGDIGWDCFTLEYKIDAPVDVVVTAWSNRQYLKVFNFLWRIKRVEFVLATTWRKCMTGARGVLQTVDKTVAETWKSTRGEIAAMIHFIGQLQYYILFEVIESSWDELQLAIHAEGCTLNDLIEAHKKYVDQVVARGLLGGKKEGNSKMNLIGDILRLMLSYRDGVDGLYSWSVADFTRRQDAEMRGGSADTTSAGTDTVFPELKNRLSELGRQFHRKVSSLLSDLAHQRDVELRFLPVVMNFNEFYQLARPARDKAGASVRK